MKLLILFYEHNTPISAYTEVRHTLNRILPNAHIERRISIENFEEILNTIEDIGEIIGGGAVDSYGNMEIVVDDRMDEVDSEFYPRELLRRNLVAQVNQSQRQMNIPNVSPEMARMMEEHERRFPRTRETPLTMVNAMEIWLGDNYEFFDILLVEGDEREFEDAFGNYATESDDDYESEEELSERRPNKRQRLGEFSFLSRDENEPSAARMAGGFRLRSLYE